MSFLSLAAHLIGMGRIPPPPPSLEKPPVSKTVTLTLNSNQTAKVDLPAGKTFAGFKFSLVSTSGGDPATEITMETSVAFSDAAADTYKASIVPVDQDGNPLGAEVSIEVIVSEDVPTQFDQPLDGSLSATVS